MDQAKEPFEFSHRFIKAPHRLEKESIEILLMLPHSLTGMRGIAEGFRSLVGQQIPPITIRQDPQR